MRRRRQRNPSIPTQNLDSFLDILTNTVGVLMFISLFVTLITVEAGNIIRTPLVAESKKIAYYFEVAGNKVNYIEQGKIDAQLDNFLRSLPTCYEPNIPKNPSLSLSQYYQEQIREYEYCQNEKNQKLKNFRGTTSHYDVQFMNSNSLVYKPKASAKRESKKELTQKNSDFRKILEELDPRINYLAFIVRPDSFEAFRVARQQARKYGFDVGWEPYETDTPIVIVFGSQGQGRAIGVQ